jgi:hypothetical protein
MARCGFRDNSENPDQYDAIEELMDMHVTKTPYVSSTLLKHELAFTHTRADSGRVSRVILMIACGKTTINAVR